MTAIQDIIKNTENLPKDFRTKLLRKLAENKDSASNVLAEVITGNYDRLPADIRNELLLKLAENEDAIGALAWAVLSDFDKLPESIRELSFKLADDKDLSWTLAKSIIDNYGKVPEKFRETLLFKLADNDYAAAYLVREMMKDYDRLPADIRNELLLKLADKEYISSEVRNLARSNLSKLDLRTIRELDRKLGFRSEPTAEKITQKDMSLTYSCWRHEKVDKESNNRKMYYFRVTVEAPTRVLDRIEYVTYRLSASLSPARKVTDRNSHFELKELARGSLTLSADVKIKGQDDIISLSLPIILTKKR